MFSVIPAEPGTLHFQKVDLRDVFYFGSSPMGLKGKSGFHLKRGLFQPVLRAENIFYCQLIPCPGKKTFASPKKVMVPFFPMRASAVSARRCLSHRVSSRRQRPWNFEGISRPFLSSAPAFFPGQQGIWSDRSTKLEMILKRKSPLGFHLGIK